MNKTATIPTSHLPTIRERVAKVNRRAERLGVEGVALHVTDERQVVTEVDEATGIKTYEQVADVEVEGPTVKVGDWTFLGTIDHYEGLTRAAPDRDAEGLADYADSADCDHCGHDRDRRQTYILENEDGERVQVGSTCIKDFLGHEVSLWVWDATDDLRDSLMGDIASGPSHFDLVDVLALTRSIVRQEGWLSRSKVGYGESATADIVWGTLTGAPTGYEATDEDREVAEDVVEWAENLDADNDYLANLARIADNGFVTHRSIGYAASMLPAYKRAEGERMEREAQPDPSPVPATDERITVEAKVLKVEERQDNYNPYGGVRVVFTVLDDRGFKLWGTVPKALTGVAKGDKVRFDARVERSDDDETFGFISRPTKAEWITKTE